ncbi:MAG: T9SS type A sorting domain-containing protein [Bacteroidota bacterium]|nr:T9SS type A sorting domain-containing protein [Bacteroidota bacterium]
MKAAFIRMGILTLAVGLHSSMMMNQRQEQLNRELDELKKQGITSRFLDDETIELSEDWSGFKRVKTLREPDEKQIRAWISHNSIPLLEIDPATIDTSQYTGWYLYWATVPVSNGLGTPPLIGDVDQNGKPEVYGNFKDYTTDFMTQIYEVDTSGRATFRYNIVPRHGGAQQFTDVDRNGLTEVMYQFGDSSFFHEQTTERSLPTRRKFAHSKWEYPGTAIFGVETVIEMDNDSLVDFVYRGSLPNTNQSGYSVYAFVAEYDSSVSNFQKIWKTEFQSPYGNVSGGEGYDVGDYDNDYKMNFLASYIFGQIWVVENISDNSYEINWTDSTPFINLYYKTSGDVDGDGMREFFVSATMSNGNWTIVYEADSNDHYFPKFLFHLLSGGSFDEPTLMTRDVDGDGKLEFVILSGADLYIFKSNENNSYVLCYYKRFSAKHSIEFYDFTGDGRKDFILSKPTYNREGQLQYSSDIYRADNVSSVEDEGGSMLPTTTRLFQNYPNPFNTQTSIAFDLPKKEYVELSLYDVRGRKVATLVSEQKPGGHHVASWNANNYPSGLYFYRLITPEAQLVKKLILIK